MVIDLPMNQAIFEAYVETQLTHTAPDGLRAR